MMLTRSKIAPRYEGVAVHFIMLLDSGRGISCRVGREALEDHLEIPGGQADGNLGRDSMLDAFEQLRPTIEAIVTEKFDSGAYGADDTIRVTKQDLDHAHGAKRLA